MIDERARRIVDAFHELYYHGPPDEGRVYERTSWMGVPCLKCPLDLWIYQEILHEIRPDLVVETGTHFGGSALFLAHMMDLIGKGQVVSIDIKLAPRPSHPRVSYVQGSSADAGLVAQVATRHDEVRMVVLDSDHSKAHVARELDLFAPLVTVGSYLIVEDTNINGHPTSVDFGPGPYEAVEEFLERNRTFVVDRSREKFLMTFNPKGFLRRVS